MKIFFLFFFAVSLSCSAFQLSFDLHSSDFTAENLFSRNIEGPSFDKDGNLYVVNYWNNGTVARVSMNGECELFLTLPDSSIANAIQFNSKNEMLMADFPMHNILKADLHTRAVSVFAHNDQFNQPNDICINKKDQLFASDPLWKANTGRLWRIDSNGTTTLLEDSMGTTNGICLSPDERTLYVNESVQRTVWKYDVDDTGNISNKQLLLRFDDFGLDGMKCDRNGNLYIARYGKGTIAVVSPGGKVIREVQLTGKNCSNLVFGGSDGRTVFVTLQDRKGMEKFRNDIPGKGYE